MYTTVLRYEKVSDASEARVRVNESFIPLHGRAPGFIAYDWIDAGGGLMISSGVLRDKAGNGGMIGTDTTPPPRPANVTAGEGVAYKPTEDVDSEKKRQRRRPLDITKAMRHRGST